MTGDVLALLSRHAADAARVFLVHEAADGTRTERTYAQQLGRAGAAAAVLSAHGVGAGDRVHVVMDNRPEFLDVLFGCAALAAVLVPVSPLSTPTELRHQLTDSGARVSVAGPGLEDPVGQAGGVPVVAVADLATEPSRLPARTPRHGTAAIMYTSGTTSLPKGVLVSHENYVAVGSAMAAHLALTAADRWLVTLPLFHANAQYYCLMSALTVGASVALTQRFSATAWPRQARDLGPTLASLFAAPVRMILARSDPADDGANALRAVLFAQNLADEQARTFESRFAAPLVQLYGMTETITPPFVNPVGDGRRWDSIGRPLPGVRIRVVDPAGRDVPPGAAGELLVGGEPGRDVTAGYHDRPAETAELLADGWLHTGDLVRIDEQGSGYFVDRAKDMIKRAGENISAGEVERVVNDHPDVLECAVHGVPDPVLDEVVVAHVVARPGAILEPADVIAWCHERLARFKVPAEVVVRDELPRTSVGKVRKAALRSAHTVEARRDRRPEPLVNQTNGDHP